VGTEEEIAVEDHQEDKLTHKENHTRETCDLSFFIYKE
jgi:hypothetical protein